MSKVSSDPLGSEPKDAEVDEAVETHQSELGLSNKEAEGIKALQAGAAPPIAGTMCSQLLWVLSGFIPRETRPALCPEQCSVPDQCQTICILQ